MKNMKWPKWMHKISDRQLMITGWCLGGVGMIFVIIGIMGWLESLRIIK